MRVAILDDWFDTLRTLPCFERLGGQDVTVFTDRVQETEPLAERLQGFDALVLIRERTEIRAPLLERLPDLLLILAGAIAALTTQWGPRRARAVRHLFASKPIQTRTNADEDGQKR